MHLNLLHVDDALKQQPLFLQQCREQQARATEAAALASELRLWGKEAVLERMTHLLGESLYRNGGSTVVSFMGSGDFHHLSALLIGLLAEGSGEKLTVIHFDNHPDWVHFSGGAHCGSWVNRALALPNVGRVITLGACSGDLKWPQFKGANLKALRDEKIVLLPWRSPSKRFRGRDIAAMEPHDFLKSLESLIPTRNVYITIDKDVLPHTDALTNWDQGQMPLGMLLATLRFVLSRHHAVGIDVTGDYSTPRYAGRPHHVALKKLEAWIDQPWGGRAQAAAVNQESNLRLLECITEAA